MIGEEILIGQFHLHIRVLMFCKNVMMVGKELIKTSQKEPMKISQKKLMKISEKEPI